MTDVFRKTGPAASIDMFTAEAEGLAALAATGVIRVPEVFRTGIDGDTAFIEMEKLPLEPSSRATELALGKRLAALHTTTVEQFGWHRDNTIGLTPQHNNWSDDWVEFFGEYRLGFQLELAAKNGYTGSLQKRGALLIKRLPMFFENHKPQPALLHGDLWGGNWGSCNGEPVIFDPAVYYGDPESDLAMTRLFGGFGAAFYEAYDAQMPRASGSHDRCMLYQLYHVLNHLNLFGSSYRGRAQDLIDNLL